MNQKKSIFITGGASGIGEATVKCFYENGWCVGFVDTDSEKGASLLQSLGNPKEVSFYPADVRDFDAILKAVDTFVNQYGEFDALFANAGKHLHENVLDTSFEAWEEIIHVNVTGVFYTVRAVLPSLLANGKGAILLMGSDQSLVAKKNSFAYGASKGAIGQMTKSLALDYAKHNIRVNSVCPATIDTPFANKILKNYAEKHHGGDFKKVMELEALEFPLERIGTPEEVAETVFFLASEKASYITGVLLPIDGGYTAK